MYHIIKVKKNQLILIALVLCSCNTPLKTLTGLYGKELCAGGGDLCAPHKLYVYSDSTFEYNECGPVVMYSKGYWHLGNNRSQIMLQTINEQEHNISKKFIDTIFLDLNNTVLKIKKRKTLEMSRYRQLFHICSQTQ